MSTPRGGRSCTIVHGEHPKSAASPGVVPYQTAGTPKRSVLRSRWHTKNATPYEAAPIIYNTVESAAKLGERKV